MEIKNTQTQAKKINIWVAGVEKPKIELSSLYRCIHIGAAKLAINQTSKLPYRDDTGDNISLLNSKFCELTALYWVWKNQKTEYIGLSHYRRFFLFDQIRLANIDRVPFCDADKDIISSTQFITEHQLMHLEKSGWIVPFERNLNSTVWNYYRNDPACVLDDLQKTILVIKELYPEYSCSVDKFFYNNKKIRCFNMFVTCWSNFDAYCKWLFPILFRVDSLFDYSTRNKEKMRAIGFLAERLFSLYLYHNKINPLEVIVGYHKNDHRLFSVYKGKSVKIRQYVYWWMQLIYDNVRSTIRLF